MLSPRIYYDAKYQELVEIATKSNRYSDFNQVKDYVATLHDDHRLYGDTTLDGQWVEYTAYYAKFNNR